MRIRSGRHLLDIAFLVVAFAVLLVVSVLLGVTAVRELTALTLPCGRP